MHSLAVDGSDATRRIRDLGADPYNRNVPSVLPPSRHLPACRAAFALLLVVAALPIAARPLERGNGPEPSTLDAHRCAEVACGNILRDLYEGLVAEAADGARIPGLAERWDVSADGLRWTFHLRDGLLWSNGEVLDANEIVASFRRALAPITAAPMAGLFDPVANAAAVRRGALPVESLGIDAPDARTVVFALERPAPLDALLVLPIAFPVWLPAVEAHGARHTRPGRLVTNGAYRLTQWTPQASLRVEANPYFREPPAIAEVGFHVTEDAAAERKRFEAGDLHVTETVPPGRLTDLRARFGDALRIAPYLGSFWFGLNLERAPFADAPALREALVLALDRDRLTSAITGLGESPAWGVVPPGVAGYVPPLPPYAGWTQAEREARARTLYAGAGHGPTNPLRVELRYNTSTPHRRMALAVAAMWRQVLGVQASLRNEEWKVFVQNRRQRVITQVFRGGWIADYDDPLSFLEGFDGDGALNWTGYRDPRFSGLLAAARAEPDPARRGVLLAEAESRLQAAHAVVPLYHYTSKHLVDPRLDGWIGNPLDRHPSRFLRWRDP